MELNFPFNLVGALVVQSILSIYYIYFIILPSYKKRKFDNLVSIIFLIRIFTMAIGDLFYPTIMVVIDFSLLFLFSFTLVPRIKKN